MAKLKGPLFSQEAHGKMAGRITFSARKSGSQVRFQRAQSDVITADRTTQRDYFIEAYGKWNTLTTAEQKQWNDFIKSNG